MRIRLSSSPLLTVGPRSWSCTPTENVLPPRIVECATLADCKAAFQLYHEDLMNHGQPAVISIGQDFRCRDRKPNGFKAFAAQNILVHADKAEKSEV